MSGEVVEELGEEDHTDYESDPDEVKISLNMRRRVASDDEQVDDGDDDDVEERYSDTRSGGVGSDGEGDGQGGADDYGDGDEDEDEYYDEYEEDEVEAEVEVVGEVEEREIGEVAETENGCVVEVKGEAEEAEEKKEVVEPFLVPTSGAFYMHDDRFRGNVAGKNRRTFGGRKLWESKDESKWGHDKFEELNLHDRRNQEGKKSSRGSYRGRGKPRGGSSAYSQGSRGRGYSEDSNQNVAPKDVRGRGPRRYQPSMKNKSDTHPPQYKQSVRSFDKSSHTGSGRMAASIGSSNMEYKAVPSKKLESNLSSASPPFYPSGASSKDIDSTQKKEMHTGNHNRHMRSSVGSNSSTPISNPILRGKNVIVSTSNDNLHIDNHVSPADTKAMNDFHLRSSTPSLNSNQLAHPRGQGRVVAPSKSGVFQSPQMNNQTNRVSTQATQANQRSPVLAQGQSPLQAPGQQMAQHPLVASQSVSPPKAGKGSGKGSLGYSGGNVGAAHGDPNMPAFFPVMQFGGQHPGGMGVPAVGMAFPGYVAQPNGNSEMTWLPMLASAAGALGATYCPPYLAVDGNYHSKPTGQTSSLPSKDNGLNKPNNETKPQQRSEVANEEFSQRQNKPRRYSEMSFSQ